MRHLLQTTVPKPDKDHASTGPNNCPAGRHFPLSLISTVQMLSVPLFSETLDHQGRTRGAWGPVMAAIRELGQEELPRRAGALNRQLSLTSPVAQPAKHGYDPLPALLTDSEFESLASAVRQRAGLLSRVLEDLYGPQNLLYQHQIPPALILGDPHFLRSMHTHAPLATPRLGLYAADIIRAPDGQFRVLRDYTGIIPGLGHALTLRRLTTGILPELFRSSLLRSIRPAREMLMGHLQRTAQPGLIAVLSGGMAQTAHSHDADDYDGFDDALLARALGVLVVEPSDLAARNGALHIKTLSGLLPVSTLIRGISGINLDPLEQGGKPGTGVTGCFGAVRAGMLAMLNAPGSALLESVALRPYIQQLFQPLLNEEPLLQASGVDASEASYAPFLGMDGGLISTPFCFRLFAWQDGQSWQVLPGGLGVPLGATAQAPVPGLKDLWVLDHAEPHMVTGIPPSEPPEKAKFLAAAHLPSRLADNLFWLGRSVERLEAAVRLLMLAIPRLESGTSLPRDLAERTLLSRCLIQANLLPDDVAGPNISGRMLRQTLARRLPVVNLLKEVERLVDASSERLSPSMLATVRFALRQALEIPLGDEASLPGLLGFTATFSGIAAENMSRDGGWLFLEMGKRLERGKALADMFAILLDGPTERLGPGMGLGIELADSVLSYELRYTSVMAPGPVLALLLADRFNPRALAFQCHALHGCLERLGTENDAQIVKALLRDITNLAGSGVGLHAGLSRIAASLRHLSDRVQRRFFTLLPEAYTLEDDQLLNVV